MGVSRVCFVVVKLILESRHMHFVDSALDLKACHYAMQYRLEGRGCLALDPFRSRQRRKHAGQALAGCLVASQAMRRIDLPAVDRFSRFGRGHGKISVDAMIAERGGRVAIGEPEIADGPQEYTSHNQDDDTGTRAATPLGRGPFPLPGPTR